MYSECLLLIIQNIKLRIYFRIMKIKKDIESNISNFFNKNSYNDLFLFTNLLMRISIIQCYNYLCTIRSKVLTINFLILVYIIEGFKFAFVDIWHKQKTKRSFLSGIERKWYWAIRQMCINKYQQESIKRILNVKISKGVMT